MNVKIAFKYKEEELLKKIYTPYSKLKLEYEAPVYLYHLRMPIDLLKRVQRRAEKEEKETFKIKELRNMEKTAAMDLPIWKKDKWT